MEIMVYALRKSGHHAIMNWVMKQLDGEIYFLDDGQRSFGDKKSEHKISNYENYDIRKLHSNPCKKIVILRDPFNWAASVYVGMQKNKHYRRNLRIDLWKLYANKFLEEKDDFVSIKFNNWFLDPEYRKERLDALGIELKDNNIKSMSSDHGSIGQSSFDGLKYKDNAQDMAVLERYKNFADNKTYRSFFDDEMYELSKNVFNFEPNF
jgi:hypothetical protein